MRKNRSAPSPHSPPASRSLPRLGSLPVREACHQNEIEIAFPSITTSRSPCRSRAGVVSKPRRDAQFPSACAAPDVAWSRTRRVCVEQERVPGLFSSTRPQREKDTSAVGNRRRNSSGNHCVRSGRVGSRRRSVEVSQAADMPYRVSTPAERPRRGIACLLVAVRFSTEVVVTRSRAVAVKSAGEPQGPAPLDCHYQCASRRGIVPIRLEKSQLPAINSLDVETASDGSSRRCADERQVYVPSNRQKP